MTQVIIYNQDNGIPAVVAPTPECLRSRTIQEIALKDVPAGKPFKIVDVADLPLEYPQEAWIIDDANLDDGIGDESNEFPNQDDDQ
jgi:hypothetical protein